jgi:L-seryl-tRNA(Ser) seleniumtransferase
MFGGRSPFDNAIRLVGAKLAVAQTHEELAQAINRNTVMIYTKAFGERLEKALAIAKKAHVVLFLDAAAAIPPFENLSLFNSMGVELYCFSGGKGLCGPQCSGLLLGRKHLIEGAMANSAPWEGAVGRPMKVGKEEIMGCLAAVEAWATIDLDELNREWNERVQRIAKIVEIVPGVTTAISIPEDKNCYPTLTVSWNEQAWGFNVADCVRALREGDPRIEVLTAGNPAMVSVLDPRDDSKPLPRYGWLQIVSMTLQPGEDLIVGQRLREILGAARKA